jgi:hypothetical protein
METALKEKLEKEGEQKVNKINNDIKNGIIIDVSGGTYLNIIKEGRDEFKEKMGRPMTYGEIREMYG